MTTTTKKPFDLAAIQAVTADIRAAQKTKRTEPLGPRLNRLNRLSSEILCHFLSIPQRKALWEMAIQSEESAWFTEHLCELAETIAAMPTTGQTEGQGMEARAVLHYFSSSTDVWISETDAGSPDDDEPGEQRQAFGIVNLGYGPEIGYINLPEILDAGLELNLHFQPSSLANVMKQYA